MTVSPLFSNEAAMTVNLKFFAGLRAFLPPEPYPFPFEAADGATVADVVAAFGVPEDKPRIILVNGVHSGLDAKLKEGDTVSLFPPVAGG